MPIKSKPALTIGLLLVALPAMAAQEAAPAGQQTASAQPSPAPPSSALPSAASPTPALPSNTPTVAPEAVAALQRMGAGLRNLSSFLVRADTIREEVLESGEKLQRIGLVEFRVRRPDHMRIDSSTSHTRRSFYYDGKQATLFGERTGYYATAPAPQTIRELLDVLSERYGIDVPLADLFLWGSDPDEVSRLRSGMWAGVDRFGEKVCDHYAFREDAADWQVWIDRGPGALPCRLVITSLADPSQPQYMADFAWTPSEAFADNIFQFTPPANAHRITFRPIEPTAAQQE